MMTYRKAQRDLADLTRLSGCGDMTAEYQRLQVREWPSPTM